MSYEIIIPEHIQKYIRSLQTADKKRLLQKIFDLKKDPFRYVIRMTDSPYYRMRVGRFRVIMDIDQETIRIYIVKVGDRSTVYS